MPPQPVPVLASPAVKLRGALASRRVSAGAVVLAALIALPVLFQGLQIDDHSFRLLLLRLPPLGPWAKPPLQLFSFYDGDPARTMALVDLGFVPWWTDPTLRVAFFRPLSALTHWI